MEKLREGLVIKAVAGLFYVESDNKVYECKSSTKLKKNKKKLLPGDKICFDFDNRYIKQVLPRGSQLIRPQIANVENAILVFSLTEPKMNFGLLDRMLMIMEYNNLKSSILLTKRDLTTKEQFDNLVTDLKYYESIGYTVLYNDEINTKEKLAKHLVSGQKYVLTGQSGVGKSTFLNTISSELDLKTQEISKALGRGKHTTRETTFYKFEDTYLIDTPGFSSLDLDLTKSEIRDNFVDFFDLKSECKFNTCYHINEPGCAVKEAVQEGKIIKQRYENYIKLMEDK